MLEVKSEYNTHPVISAEIRKNLVKRSEIINLEAIIRSDEKSLTAEDYPLSHYFAPGVYAREIFLPQGHVVVGKIHKHSHLNIISYGHVVVATEEGPAEFIGPCTFTSPSGVKRAVYAITDTLWTTIHVTNEIDLDKIEDEIISDSFESLEEYRRKLR